MAPPPFQALPFSLETKLSYNVFTNCSGLIRPLQPASLPAPLSPTDPQNITDVEVENCNAKYCGLSLSLSCLQTLIVLLSLDNENCHLSWKPTFSHSFNCQSLKAINQGIRFFSVLQRIKRVSFFSHSYECHTCANVFYIKHLTHLFDTFAPGYCLFISSGMTLNLSNL